MKIIIMDSKTKKTASVVPYNELDEHAVSESYSDGNDGCDCNRSLNFDRANNTTTSDEIEESVGEGVCYLSKRFIVVDIEGYNGDKNDFVEGANSNYDKLIVDACMKEYQLMSKATNVIPDELNTVMDSIRSRGGDPLLALTNFDAYLKRKHDKSDSLISCISCVVQNECTLKGFITNLVQAPETVSKDDGPMFDSGLYVHAALKCISFEPIKDPVFTK